MSDSTNNTNGPRPKGAPLSMHRYPGECPCWACVSTAAASRPKVLDESAIEVIEQARETVEAVGDVPPAQMQDEALDDREGADWDLLQRFRDSYPDNFIQILPKALK